MRPALCLITGVLACVAAGCASNEPAGQAETVTYSVTEEAIAEFLVMSAPNLRPGCEPEMVARVISDFAAAWTAGDAAAVEALLAPPRHGNVLVDPPDEKGEHRFNRLLDGVRDPDNGFVNTSYGPGEVGAYIEKRHANKDRLRLLTLQVRAGEKGTNTVYGQVALERSAADIGSGVSSGLYDLNCGTGTIYSWHVWLDPAEVEIPCAKREDLKPDELTVLVC